MTVALNFGSDRTEMMQAPLEAVGIETVVNPDEYSPYNAVICDSPGLVSNHVGFHGPVLCRLRGNYWRVQNSGIRSVLKDALYTRLCDGVLTPDMRLDGLVHEHWHDRTAVVGLPIQPDEWPTVQHTDESIRAVTLTNFDYRKKIAPLYPYTDHVAEWLSDIDGTWVICGDGDHSDEFATHCENLEGVCYGGYQPAKSVLQRSNVVLHPSNMDIAMPNAILEGIASNVPVVTSDTPQFADNNAVLSVSASQLPSTLRTLRNPTTRTELARDGQAILYREHSHTAIGHKIRSFVEGFL